MDIMVDLETMGTGPNAAIISIGAVKFTKEGILDDKFYRVIDLGSSIHEGGEVDGDTILWWLQQSDEARAAFKESGVYLSDALREFYQWVPSNVDGVWGNGASFDNTILSSAYRNMGIPTPWHFTQDRCFRTMKNLVPIQIEREGVHHNALADAEHQARHLIEIWKRLRVLETYGESTAVNAKEERI